MSKNWVKPPPFCLAKQTRIFKNVPNRKIKKISHPPENLITFFFWPYIIRKGKTVFYFGDTGFVDFISTEINIFGFPFHFKDLQEKVMASFHDIVISEGWCLDLEKDKTFLLP